MSVEKMSKEMHEKATIFFIRITDGDVPSFDVAGSVALMDFFEICVLPGDPLFGIANLMQQVYIPTISKGLVALPPPPPPTTTAISEDTTKVPDTIPVPVADIDDGLRNELKANMQKFEQQLRNAVQQSRGDVRLFIPNITIASPEEAATDASVVEELEGSVDEWTATIAAAVESEHQRTKILNHQLQKLIFGERGT